MISEEDEDEEELQWKPELKGAGKRTYKNQTYKNMSNLIRDKINYSIFERQSCRIYRALKGLQQIEWHSSESQQA